MSEVPLYRSGFSGSKDRHEQKNVLSKDKKYPCVKRQEGPRAYNTTAVNVPHSPSCWGLVQAMFKEIELDIWLDKGEVCDGSCFTSHLA
jgi:hypothetical protein